MERLARLDLPALLALLEREASKDSLDLLASRDFLVLPVPLVREASLVIWVFLERVELLVLLDPEVSVDSQEREEVLALRVCRDPVVCLELPEPMDPREPLALLVGLEPKDPLAFRACPESEAPQASQDPRETEVTMARKDPRVLPAKTAEEVSLVPLAPLVLVAPTERRVNRVPLDHQVLLVPVVLLVTGVRLVLMDLLDLLDPRVLMVSQE